MILIIMIKFMDKDCVFYDYSEGLNMVLLWGDYEATNYKSN